MKGRTRQILLHIIGCLAFLTLPVLIAPNQSSLSELLTMGPTRRDILGNILLLGFFYLNSFVLIPRLYFDKKYLPFFLIVFLCYLLISFVPSVLIPDRFGQQPPRQESRSAPPSFRDGPPSDAPVMDHAPGLQEGPVEPPQGHHLLPDLARSLFTFLVVFLFSLMLQVSDQWKRTQEEKLQAELSYLKAQINPHFLFNTLNSIYSLAIEKSDHTATAVVKLSGMMRYVLSEAGNDFVPMEKELAYIRSYIELQQIRFGDALPLSFSVYGDPAGKKIAPLILIPFVENAFKHGVNAEENADIRIRIDIEKEYLHLQVYNRKVTVRQREEEKSGLGILNTQNRLQLLYPGRHELNITDQKKDFSVSLTLHLV